MDTKVLHLPIADKFHTKTYRASRRALCQTSTSRDTSAASHMGIPRNITPGLH